MASIAELFFETPVSADRLLAAARRDAALVERVRSLHIPLADFVADWVDSIASLLDTDLEDVLIHGAMPLTNGNYRELAITINPSLDWRDLGRIVLESTTRARLSLVNVDGSYAQKSNAKIEFGSARNWRGRLELALQAQNGQHDTDYFHAQQMLRLPERLYF